MPSRESADALPIGVIVSRLRDGLSPAGSLLRPLPIRFDQTERYARAVLLKVHSGKSVNATQLRDHEILYEVLNFVQVPDRVLSSSRDLFYPG